MCPLPLNQSCCGQMGPGTSSRLIKRQSSGVHRHIHVTLSQHLKLLATADEAAVEGVVTLGRMTCTARMSSSTSRRLTCRLLCNVNEIRAGLASSKHACLEGAHTLRQSRNT